MQGKPAKRVPDLLRYSGKWVALSRNRVVAVGASLPEIMRQVSRRGARGSPSLFLVPHRDEGPYVLVLML